jgi:hypothetical protein
MATDYAEKERMFVAELKADTGRDLDAWMQAISDANLPHRNDVIDWLRTEGFTFANASWLERIHANGGRLIYSDDVPPPERQTNSAQQPKADAEIIAFEIARKPQTTAPATAPAIARTSLPATAFAPDMETDALLSAAKGLRPLAILALGEILRILPDTKIAAEGPLIVLSAPRRYLALLPAPKALRFYGDFAGHADERVTHAENALKAPGKPPPPFPAALSLSDARLVDATFAEIVKTAARRAHS